MEVAQIQKPIGEVQNQKKDSNFDNEVPQKFIPTQKLYVGLKKELIEFFIRLYLIKIVKKTLRIHLKL